jgi:hypothetical protein
MDLVGRKLGMDGAVVEGFFALIEADLAKAAASRIRREAVTKALALLRTATQGLKGADIDQSGGAAVDYLRLFALVALGWMWVRMAAAPGDTPQHQAKRALAAFYAQRVLPQTEGLAAALASRRLRCSPCPPTPSDLVRSPS